MEEFLGDPGNRLDLWLEPGQIQILSERGIDEIVEATNCAAARLGPA